MTGITLPCSKKARNSFHEKAGECTDEFMLVRGDAARAPTVRDRFAPGVPVSAHRVDR